MYCYHCDILLTNENESVEHIIPNAIGGRLKSKKLLCKSCNSLLGELYDSELCKSLMVISGVLDIKRQKGVTQDIKNVRSDSGRLYNLVNGRHPVPIAPEIKINEADNNVHLSVRNEKELRHIIKKLKKKYPNLDDTNVDEKMVKEKYYMDEALHMNISVGSGSFMKAILKIAINFYLYMFENKIDISERIQDLKKTGDIDINVLRHYYFEDSIKYESDDEVSHTIFIKGDNKKKLLFAFVEIFSSFAFIINLNTDYQGSDITAYYCYDVLRNVKINKQVNIDYNGSLNGDPTLLNKEFIERVQKKIERVMAIGDKRQTKGTISDISKDVVANTLSKYPEGTIFTEEMLNEVLIKARQEFGSFFKHLNNRNRKSK